MSIQVSGDLLLFKLLEMFCFSSFWRLLLFKLLEMFCFQVWFYQRLERNWLAQNSAFKWEGRPIIFTKSEFYIYFETKTFSLSQQSSKKDKPPRVYFVLTYKRPLWFVANFKTLFQRLFKAVPVRAFFRRFGNWVRQKMQRMVLRYSWESVVRRRIGQDWHWVGRCWKWIDWVDWTDWIDWIDGVDWIRGIGWIRWDCFWKRCRSEQTI